MYTKALLGTAITAAALSAAICSAAAAEKQIATVARITGNAVVSKGAQYVPGTEGMALTVGQRVMSLEDSTVVIQFNDGCRYTVEENKLVTMEDLSPCVLTKGVALAPPPPAAVPVPCSHCCRCCPCCCESCLGTGRRCGARRCRGRCVRFRSG